jgi:hypothetical protein
MRIITGSGICMAPASSMRTTPAMALPAPAAMASARARALATALVSASRSSASRCFRSKRTPCTEVPPAAMATSSSVPTRDTSSTRTSKCRCGPVERPVEPTSAIRWPCLTMSPAFTSSFDACA